MKGLSIRQPWVHAILHFGKRIENREWDPQGGNLAAARRLIASGGAFLIHASAGCTRDEFADACDFMRDVYRAQPWEGSTIVTALPNLTRGALVARARLVDIIRPCSVHPSPWYVGGVGLVLDDVEPLPEPIPFKGALGFFDVPEHVIGRAA